VKTSTDLERYNRHGALEASKWPGAFAGVELTNEWNTLILAKAARGCNMM
jgi:hypothetical protein